MSREDLARVVHDHERDAFGSARPRREDDEAAPGSLHRVEQFRHVLGPILAVAVHDDDRIARDVTFDIREPDRDRALVAEVPPQVEDVHIETGRRKRRRELAGVGPGPVVHEQNARVAPRRWQHPIELDEQPCHGGPVVVDRDQDQCRHRRNGIRGGAAVTPAWPGPAPR